MNTEKDLEESTQQALTIPVVRSSFFNFKYKWSMRKYWIGWFKCDINKWYYSKIHRFNMGGFNGTMIPTTGKGKFISVYSKGKIIQIKHESGYEHLEYDEIRIIPCKENHGVMVERFKNGKMCERNHMDLNQFNKSIIFASNVEQLVGR
jgi:hypothetical protein